MIVTTYSISEMDDVVSSVCLFFLQSSMELQQVLANLPEPSFLSASSSKGNNLIICLWSLLETELFQCTDWSRTFCCTGSSRKTWCVHTQQVMKLIQASWQSMFVFCAYIGFIIVTLWHLGVGNPLSPERTRMLLALRINVLAKGHSGISLETLHAMIQAFNGKLQLDSSSSSSSLYHSWYHLLSADNYL